MSDQAPVKTHIIDKNKNARINDFSFHFIQYSNKNMKHILGQSFIRTCHFSERFLLIRIRVRLKELFLRTVFISNGFYSEGFRVRVRVRVRIRIRIRVRVRVQNKNYSEYKHFGEVTRRNTDLHPHIHFDEVHILLTSNVGLTQHSIVLPLSLFEYIFAGHAAAAKTQATVHGVAAEFPQKHS